MALTDEDKAWIKAQIAQAVNIITRVVVNEILWLNSEPGLNATIGFDAGDRAKALFRGL